MTYALHLGTMLCIYAMLALTLNLVVGYGGMLSLCQGAFFGIGAYTTALLMLKAGWGFFPSVGAAVLITAILSLSIGLPALRLRGDYFILGTLGFQVIVFNVLYNWTELTGGSNGLTGIPHPVLFGGKLSSPQYMLLLACGLAMLVGLVVWCLQRSPFGRTIRLIRDDAVAAAALGKPVATFKIAAFAISAGLAAIPGGLFAVHARYIDPTSFTLTESIFILSLVIIGGAGSMIGPLIGTMILLLLPEALSFIPNLQGASAANLHQVFYGCLLVGILFWRPQGIAGEYSFD